MKVFSTVIAFVIVLTIPATLACAYGNGGGEVEMDNSFGGSTVSWSENPNGLDSPGLSTSQGRPESSTGEDSQSVATVDDVLQDFLDHIETEYEETTKEIPICISDAAQRNLDNTPSGGKAAPVSGPGVSSTSVETKDTTTRMIELTSSMQKTSQNIQLMRDILMQLHDAKMAAIRNIKM